MKLPHPTSIAAILLAISGIVIALTIEAVGPEKLSEFGTIPDFTLVDRSGQTIGRSDFDGRVWLVDFIFTNCAGMCPLMTDQMSHLQDVLPQEVLLVSFTVDPTRDTTMVLASYANRYQADPDRWYFLTGSRDELYDLAHNGFHLSVGNPTDSVIEPIAHSTRFVLVDQQGEIRSYYDGTDPGEVKRIISDVRSLLNE